MLSTLYDLGLVSCAMHAVSWRHNPCVFMRMCDAAVVFDKQGLLLIALAELLSFLHVYTCTRDSCIGDKTDLHMNDLKSRCIFLV